MKKLFRLLAVLFMAVQAIGLYTSCSDNNCSMMGRSMINCNFYTVNPDTRKVERDTIDWLTITALGSDSVIVNQEKKVTMVMLPLRYTSDTTALVFHYDAENPKVCDTMVIVQTNTPFFESLECGYTMRQAMNSVTYTKHVMDSVYMRNKEANTNGTENLKIFHPFTD